MTTDFTKELRIDILNVWDVGTYTLGSFPNNSAYFSSSPLGGGLVTSYGSSSYSEGVLTVTSYNANSIKGSFNFKAFGRNGINDTIRIIGTFDVKVYE